MLGLYRYATRFSGPLIKAGLQLRARQGKEHHERWRERLGRTTLERPDGSLLWLHAASVGESRSVLPLIGWLLRSRADLQVLITTGTVTSAALLKEQLPERARHQFAPVDRPQSWSAFLDHWRPNLGLLVESELWPNLFAQAGARRIPLALINGRMSERSYRRWSRLPNGAAELLANLAQCLTQSDADRMRFRSLGASNAITAGNLKYAARSLSADPASLAELAAAIGERPVWLAASVHPGEGTPIFEAHSDLARDVPDLLTVIVPRHPADAGRWGRQARQAGLRVAQRSRGQPVQGRCAVYLADTLGELGLFYRLAWVALVGGSLVPHGGQNPLEAAKLGCPILLGPHLQNFSEMREELIQAGAATPVADGEEMRAALGVLLRDRPRRFEMARRGRDLAERVAPAGRETLVLLGPLLDQTLGKAHASA